MKQVAIFGIGISGLSLIDYLLNNNYQIIAIDDQQTALEKLKSKYQDQPQLLKNIQFCFNKNEINWKNIEFLVLSPGIPLKYPKPHEIVVLANKNNCKIIGDIELFYLFNKDKNFIGITGTNGKSTTTALTSHIFKEGKINSEMGGNIGIPCFDLKLAKNYIFEISSYQLDLSEQTHFHIAAILNITPDHLDRHKDMKGYVEAKKRIFLRQKKGDFALLNMDDSNCRHIAQELKNDKNFAGKIVGISLQKSEANSISLINDQIINNLNGKKIDLEELPYLKGNHNKQNLLFAYSIAYLSGINDDKILEAIRSFRGLKHRAQLITKINNISFINDSKGTNIESTICALQAYDNIFWIAGGITKTNDLSPLIPYLSKIKKAFLIGQDQKIFADFLNEQKIENYICDNLDKAFKQAVEIAKKTPKEINILLSPACASFDQWKNFEERGNYFETLTNQLKNEK